VWQNIMRAAIAPACSARATIIVGCPDFVMFVQVFIKLRDGFMPHPKFRQ
jgi:hypothetical protein